MTAALLAAPPGISSASDESVGFEMLLEPGDTTATIRVKIRGDRRRESDETFFVYLGDPVGATLADDEGMGTIVNDD